MKSFNFLEINNAFAFILLTIVIFGAYFNTFNNPFLWDDDYLIKKNIFIRDARYIKNIFFVPLFHFQPSCNANFYRPVQTLSYLADYHFWKLNNFGYHLTNILIHIINTIFVYLLINILFKTKELSLLVSLLFAICPLHVSVVTYISGRADLIVAFFILSALILFIKSIQRNNNFYYLVSLSCFLLSLLSKESALIFPLILILIHTVYKESQNDIPNSKKAILKFSPFFLFSLTYIMLRFTILNFGNAIPIEHKGNSYLRIITFSKIIISYIKLIFLPVNLYFQRTIQISHTILEPFTLACVIGVICILAIIIKTSKSKRSNIIFWSLSWFLIGLFPIYFILSSYGCVANKALVMMAEHWLYIPSIGLFTLIAFIILTITRAMIINLKQAILRKTMLSIIVVMPLFFVVQTIKTNMDWKDEVVLNSKVLRYNPDNICARKNLGAAYFERGNFQEAMLEFRNTLKYIEQLNPETARSVQAEIFRNIGIVYFYQGLYIEAKNQLAKALKVNPLDAQSYGALGVIYAQQGQYTKAIANIERSLEINSYNAETYNNLGLVYANMGDRTKAIEIWQKAIDIDPDFLEAKRNLQRVNAEKDKKPPI